MTDEQESATADTKHVNAENESMNSPENQINDNDNKKNSFDNNSIQTRSEQNENNSESTKEGDITKSPGENASNSDLKDNNDNNDEKNTSQPKDESEQKSNSIDDKPLIEESKLSQLSSQINLNIAVLCENKDNNNDNNNNNDNIDSKSINQKDAESKEINQKNVDSKEVNHEDDDSKEINQKNVDSKEVNHEDADSKEINQKNVDSKEVNHENADSKEINQKNVDSKEFNQKDADSKENNQSDVDSKEINQKDAAAENPQSQNLNNIMTNGINQNSEFLRSFSTNKISQENNANNGPIIFHRQISITNSNNNTSNFPIQQHLSAPLIPLYGSNDSQNNNTNSLLSFQYQYHNQTKPIIPVISMNGFSQNSNNKYLSQIPGTAPIIQQHPQQQKKHHHHHHHHKKHHSQEQPPQEEQDQEQDQQYDDRQPTKSPLGISPSDLEELLSKEDDEPELELTPQTSAALETFKKTGKLHFTLPGSSQTALSAPSMSSRAAPNSVAALTGNNPESVSYSPTIIRKLQRDKVNAIIKGRYDEAKEADSLSKRVTTAVIESVEEDKRAERLRIAEWKLEEEKKIFLDVHQNCIEKVKEEEEALNKRMVSLDEIHIAEQRQFEEKWNNEDFLRRFSKPSSSLLQLKAVERSMAISKMFDEAKVVRSRAEQLERIETKEKQNRAEQEMKVERSRLLERQKKEKQGLKEKCDNLLNIAKKNMEKEESPYKARISRLESIVAELKNGNENKCKIVPSKVHSSLISPRGTGNELLTARTAFKFSAYKVTSQSTKLKIKPLGCVTLKEKKKSKTSKK